MSEDACHRCGAPATLLCDYVLGFELHEIVPARVVQGRYIGEHRVTSGDKRCFTCDRPLCEACAVNKGAMFFCGEEGGMESRDYCPAHADDSLHPEPMVVITETEADAIRNRLCLRIFAEPP